MATSINLDIRVVVPKDVSMTTVFTYTMPIKLKVFYNVLMIATTILFSCSEDITDLTITPDKPDVPNSDVVDLGTWSSASPMPTSRKEISNTTIEYNGKIYVFGGIGKGGVITNSLEIYDIRRDKWSSGRKMPIQVWRSSVAIFSGKLYMMGGFQSLVKFPYEPTNRLFEYDPQFDTWTEKAPMPTEKGSALAVNYNNRIHILGGSNARTLRTHEIYDPINNSWTTGSPMHTARTGMTGVVYRGNLYVIGGYSVSARGSEELNVNIELYNGYADQWKSGPTLPIGRKGIAATLLNEKIYVFGGSIGSNVSLTLELDPKTHEWRELAEMPSPVSYMGVTSFQNSIYVLGGSPIAVNNQEAFDNNRRFTPPE